MNQLSNNHSSRNAYRNNYQLLPLLAMIQLRQVKAWHGAHHLMIADNKHDIISFSEKAITLSLTVLYVTI